MTTAKRYDNYINGEWVAGADYSANINPSELSDTIGDYAKADLAQVNAAIAQLDQGTQQNAALVEQSAAAADSLREQAQRLSEVVAVFRLDAAAPALLAVLLPALWGALSVFLLERINVFVGRLRH